MGSSEFSKQQNIDSGSWNKLDNIDKNDQFNCVIGDPNKRAKPASTKWRYDLE